MRGCDGPWAWALSLISPPSTGPFTACLGRWWLELERRVRDEVVEAIAVVASPQEAGRRLAERYGGLADLVAICGLPRPLEDEPFWRRLVAQVRS